MRFKTLKVCVNRTPIHKKKQEPLRRFFNISAKKTTATHVRAFINWRFQKHLCRHRSPFDSVFCPMYASAPPPALCSWLVRLDALALQRYPPSALHIWCRRLSWLRLDATRVHGHGRRRSSRRPTMLATVCRSMTSCSPQRSMKLCRLEVRVATISPYHSSSAAV